MMKKQHVFVMIRTVLVIKEVYANARPDIMHKTIYVFYASLNVLHVKGLMIAKLVFNHLLSRRVPLFVVVKMVHMNKKKI